MSMPLDQDRDPATMGLEAATTEGLDRNFGGGGGSLKLVRNRGAQSAPSSIFSRQVTVRSLYFFDGLLTLLRLALAGGLQERVLVFRRSTLRYS